MAKKDLKNKAKAPSANQRKEISATILPSDPSKEKLLSNIIAFLLAVATVVVYSGVFSNDFIYYDDNTYVTENSHVQQGLSWGSIRWAFTALYAYNWHPLTWLSHMLDVQLFGLNPGGHHFTSLFLHILATLLLFGFLRYATRKLWISAFVAALFALHPAHVESVAWIAERKDVLSAVFCFATLWAYIYYVRQPAISRYGSVLILFALGLMAKPMLVTLPLVLLLLDYWPLERLSLSWRSVGQIVLEKLPLLVLSAASAIITVSAQHEAIAGFSKLHFAPRILNAVVSYCVYLGQVFWPSKLTAFYPYTQARLASNAILCGLLLAAITTAVLLFGGKKKYLITGWLWFIVMLIPVIGIVQVGGQAHADRYTYIPFIGLFVIAGWGANSYAVKAQGGKRMLLRIAIVIVLVALAAKTWKQVRYWKNDFTLFSYALEVTKRNYIAYNHLGYFFERAGRTDNALAYYQKALEISEYGDAHYNAANMLLQKGRADEAISHYRRALEINPNKIKTLSNLAGAYVQKGQFSDAMPLMQRALALAMASGDESQVKDITGNIELLNKAISSAQKKP